MIAGWRWWSGAAGLAGLLVLGCGSSSSKKTDGGSGGSACADYAGAFCAEFQACAPGLFQIFGFSGLSECTSFYEGSCNDSLTAPHSGWTAPRAEQCGSEYAGMDCTTFLGQGGVPGACVVQGGTVPNGGGCSTPWQCSSGRCSATSIGQCGSCLPPVSLNQPCDPNNLLGSLCADNLVCAVTATSPTTPVCTTPVSMGGACIDSAACPISGYCDSRTQTCTKLPGVGQGCAYGSIYFCDPTQTAAICNSMTSTCEPVTVASPGEACGQLADSYATCTGTCDIASDAGAGTCSSPPSGQPSCALSDTCTLDSPCFDSARCTALVCAGAVDASASLALEAERLPGFRPRRELIGSGPHGHGHRPSRQ